MPRGKQHRKSYIGEKFHRLTVLEDLDDIVTPHGLVRMAKFQCGCGNVHVTRLHSVRGGNTKSCGCQKIESTRKVMTTHGLTTTKLGKKIYIAWNDIKRRCYDTDHKEFKRYGAVGIGLQDSWVSDATSFHEYVSNLPNCSVGMSLDRIDNDLGYCEGNLRWATDAQQTRNQGKQQNNTSGICGVTWYENSTGGTRAIAWWNVDGKARSKSFSVKKLGLLPAFNLACEYSAKMIVQLNEQGFDYSDKHGL